MDGYPQCVRRSYDHEKCAASQGREGIAGRQIAQEKQMGNCVLGKKRTVRAGITKAGTTEKWRLKANALASIERARGRGGLGKQRRQGTTANSNSNSNNVNNCNATNADKMRNWRDRRN